MSSNAPSPWSTQEELMLVHAWIHHKEDKITLGPPHLLTGTFWDRVTSLFHYELNKSAYRTRNEVQAKWLDLTKKVKTFDNIFHSMENAYPDADDEDVVFWSKEHYILQSNGEDFELEGCWSVLRYIPYF